MIDVEQLNITEIPKIIRDLLARVEKLERQKDPDRWISRSETMQILGIKSTKLWQLQKDGLLKNHNPTGHPKFAYSEVMKIVADGNIL